MDILFRMKRRRPSSSGSNKKIKPPPARPSTPEVLTKGSSSSSSSSSSVVRLFRPISPRSSCGKRCRDATFKQHVKRSKVDDLEEMMKTSHVDEIKSIEQTIRLIQNFLNVCDFATVDHTRILSQKYKIDKLQERLNHADVSHDKKQLLQIKINHLKAIFRLKKESSRKPALLF